MMSEKKPIKAVQQFMLGTVMNKEAQAVETMHRMKAAGYEGIELCGFMIKPMSMAVKLLTKAAGMPVGNGGKLNWIKLVKESGLKTVSVHEQLGYIENETSSAIEEAKSFDTDNIVVTAMYRFDYCDRENVKKLAERLNKAGQKLKDSNIKLLYHNHNCEFVPFRDGKYDDGRCAYELLMNNTDENLVSFEFDSYWVSDAGVNALEIMTRLGQRLKLYHITDRGCRQSGAAVTPILKMDCMECGTGCMDLAALINQAEKADAEAVILESHRNWTEKSPVRSFEVSAEFLNKHI